MSCCLPLFWRKTSPPATTISMLDELPLACYCDLWCGCCCYCDAGPHTRVCVLIRDGFLLNAITSFTVCVRLADLSGLDINSEQPSEKKPHTTFSFCWCSPAIFFRFFLFFLLFFYIFSIPTGCSMSSGKRNVFDLLYICLFVAKLYSCFYDNINVFVIWNQFL